MRTLLTFSDASCIGHGSWGAFDLIDAFCCPAATAGAVAVGCGAAVTAVLLVSNSSSDGTRELRIESSALSSPGGENERRNNFRHNLDSRKIIGFPGKACSCQSLCRFLQPPAPF